LPPDVKMTFQSQKHLFWESIFGFSKIGHLFLSIF
jgi:hypothetical protein